MEEPDDLCPECRGESFTCEICGGLKNISTNQHWNTSEGAIKKLRAQADDRQGVIPLDERTP